MSDRTYFQMTIHGCPPGEVATIADLLEEHGLQVAVDDSSDLPEGRLALGERYVREEMVCGSARDVAKRLCEVAPGASWELWEDPAYEWLGEVFRHTPTLGLFNAECNSDGAAVFTPDEVRAVWRLPDRVDPLTGVSPRERALGEAHRAALRTLDKESDGETLAPHA